MKRIAVALSTIVFLICVLAPPAEAIRMTKPERRLLALVNKTRRSHGLHRLRMSCALERASRSHSRDMAKHAYFSHSSYSGESFSSRLIRFGFGYSGCTYWKVGENIAYRTAGTPRQIFRSWMNSADHKAIILTKAFRRAGIGRAVGSYAGSDDTVFFTLDAGVRR